MTKGKRAGDGPLAVEVEQSNPLVLLSALCAAHSDQQFQFAIPTLDSVKIKL